MLQIEQLISLFAPLSCSRCQTPGASICSDCLLSKLPSPSSRCGICNVLTINFKTCQRCRKTAGINHIMWAGEYKTELKDYLWRYKFHRQRSLAKPFAELLYEQVEDLSFDLVVNVPTAPNHIRQRGFDHGRHLLREFVRLTGAKSDKPIARIDSQRQVGTPQKQRWSQAASQYALKKAAHKRIKDKHILLIDDICTSGASLAAVARLLKKSGAKQVDAAVVARG